MKVGVETDGTVPSTERRLDQDPEVATEENEVHLYPGLINEDQDREIAEGLDLPAEIMKESISNQVDLEADRTRRKEK